MVPWVQLDFERSFKDCRVCRARALSIAAIINSVLTSLLRGKGDG